MENLKGILNNNMDTREIDYQKTFDNVIVVEKDDVVTAEINKPLFKICGKIPVYKNDRFLSSHGALIACITISSETNNPFIIVDSLFDKLSFNAKLFAIYHELGHYQNGDFLIRPKESLKKRIKYRMRRFIKEKIQGGYDEREVLADYYACDKMNSTQCALDALEEINELLIESVRFAYSNNEFKLNENIERLNKIHNKRIRSIKEMILEGPYFIDEERKEFEIIYKDDLVNKEIQENLPEAEANESLERSLALSAKRSKESLDNEIFDDFN